MSCVQDIIAVSGLAIRAQIAYKNAQRGYRHISTDIAALHILIDKVAQHFRNTTIGSEDRQYGRKLLKSCQTVLEDLNSFIGKYKRLAAINRRLLFGTVKLGNKDITALRSQLISETVLLNGFVRRWVVLALHSTLSIL